MVWLHAVGSDHTDKVVQVVEMLIHEIMFSHETLPSC